MDEKQVNTSEDRATFKALFEKATNEMIATSWAGYKGEWALRYTQRPTKLYTREEVEHIICKGSLLEQQRLSQDFFERDGFYRKLLIYYATLYMYNGILIPNSSSTTNLSQKTVQKRYRNACNFLDQVDIKGILRDCALGALVNGTYYGVIQTLDKDTLSVLELPASYCRSRYKNKQGIDLIEFDVKFFDQITDPDLRETTLKVYPKKLSNWYRRWKRGEVASQWAFVPDEEGICFPMYDGKPLFLNVIPAAMDYDTALKVEKERDEEEIRKIITVQIPHLQDGSLLFEPDEAAVMHRGIVEMLKGNENVSVLTTYGVPDVIASKTTNDASRSNLEKMMKNIYYEAGVSPNIFSAESNLAIETSISNDMAAMSPLIDKFNLFITGLVNRLYGNTALSFHYVILPVSWYNQSKFVDTTYKLATSGYSFLMPAIAMGISQSDLTNLKDLENTILKLDEKLKPLSSAFTSSAAAQEEAGAPTKDNEETSDKTEQNKISLENQGGSTN